MRQTKDKSDKTTDNGQQRTKNKEETKKNQKQRTEPRPNGHGDGAARRALGYYIIFYYSRLYDYVIISFGFYIV